QAAIAAFDCSLETYPENSEARKGRAQSYYRLGLKKYGASDYPAAILALSQSLEDDPKSVAALFARGQSFYRASDLVAAQKDYVNAATIESRGLFWFCAGTCGLTDKSGFSYLEKALSTGYEPAVVRCNLGVMMRMEHKP